MEGQKSEAKMNRSQGMHFAFVLYFEPIGVFAKDLACQESGLLFDVAA